MLQAQLANPGNKSRSAKQHGGHEKRNKQHDNISAEGCVPFGWDCPPKRLAIHVLFVAESWMAPSVKTLPLLSYRLVRRLASPKRRWSARSGAWDRSPWIFAA